MKRVALYSSAGKGREEAGGRPPGPPSGASSDAAALPPAQPVHTRQEPKIGLKYAYRAPLLVLIGLLAVFSGVALDRHWAVRERPITQKDIDRAVRTSLEKSPLPSQAAKAFETIHPSIVRVDGIGHPEGLGNLPKASDPAARKKETEKQDKPGNDRQSVGTGVVITESGSILTNLHVVISTSRIRVHFADGSESEAVITGVDPENDLAVLRAYKIPDDLQPATLVTTGDLRPGDEVLAVGFPFGFGPSASTGVVSGLKREFVSSDGKRTLSNLIQFDAAANPGNSGGPLVNMEGEVLGIVTAILNPLQQRFFVGLAFAVPIENAVSAVGIPPF